MHNVAVGLIAGIIVMLSAAACGETEVDPDPDLFGSSRLSEIIRDDFYGRYSGGVTVTDVLTYDDGKTYVWFTDTDGLPCCSIYKDEAWIFTQKEYDKTDFAYTSVFYVERKDGAYYGLEMETGRLTSRTVFLKI